MKKIKIGYEVGTGEEVKIEPSHLIVTGLTQLSGKTTTLEALIKRSGLKAIVFKTKIGEKSFASSQEVPPFFRDRSDYEFVKSLIEAYAREKLFIEKGTLMQLCKGSATLVEIQKKVDDKIAEGKLRGLKEEIHIRLQHYLENLIPQIKYANFSKTLQISEGINVMNLERFSEEAQSLIIQSVADEVLKTMNNTILVIPEAWKFTPQKYNNPCKRTIESYIRQGAANKNFIWLDSQDMSGVDKIPLKQISTWILGFQSERNEVKHTLDQIALPKASKPKEEEIMTLRTGHFILSNYDGVKKVYVQPVWLDDDNAIKMAKGEIEAEDIKHLENQLQEIPVYGKSPVESAIESVLGKRKESSPEGKREIQREFKQEINQLRIDFFNKITEIVEQVRQVYSRIYTLENKSVQQIDQEDIVSLVLQKMPQNDVNINKQVCDMPIDEEALIRKIIAKIPQSTGSKVYKVPPLEKIRKNFLEEAKKNILTRIENLSDDEKKTLKYIESREKEVTNFEIVTKCFILKQSGGSSGKISKILNNLISAEVIVKSNSRYRGNLTELIKSLTALHGTTDEEIKSVYDHILMNLLGGKNG